MASSSSPFDRDENFLNGLRPSADTEGTGEQLEDVEHVDAVEGTTETGFNGEIATLVLGGDKSKFSLRGAQLTGTLKLKFQTISSYEIIFIFAGQRKYNYQL